MSTTTEQAAFEAWCPYKGSPDPRAVWSAAWSAALATPPAAPATTEQAERTMALVDDYTDHFADATASERQTPCMADVAVLKVKKDAIRAALATPPPADEFERGRQQGILQERALWELAAEGQAIEAVPAEPNKLTDIDRKLIHSVSKFAAQAEPPKPVAFFFRFHTSGSLEGKPNMRAWQLEAGEPSGILYRHGEVRLLIDAEPVTAASEPAAESRFVALRAKGVLDADDNLDCWDTPPYDIAEEHVRALTEKDPSALWRVAQLYVLVGPEPVRAEPAKAMQFAGWFSEIPSAMSYRLWEQGGHEQQDGDVALYF